MNPFLISLGIMVCLLGSMLLALEAGFRLGRRAAGKKEPPPPTLVGPVQGALLGLLGLLLGFSFAGSAGRFMERQDLIVQEANAIGTAYLRAGLLNEPHRSALTTSLAEYLKYRIEVSSTLHRALTPGEIATIGRQQSAIWKAAGDGVSATPTAMLTLLNPVNEVLDLHTMRLAAGRKHLPLPLLGLLILCAWLAIGVIGYGCGLCRQRVFPMTGALAFLMAAALWITIDLDHPRNGLIRLSDAPLHELQRSLTVPE